MGRSCPGLGLSGTGTYSRNQKEQTIIFYHYSSCNQKPKKAKHTLEIDFGHCSSCQQKPQKTNKYTITVLADRSNPSGGALQLRSLVLLKGDHWKGPPWPRLADLLAGRPVSYPQDKTQNPHRSMQIRSWSLSCSQIGPTSHQAATKLLKIKNL